LLSRLSVIIWVVLWLLVFELLLYTLVPPTPVGVKPNRFQRYLEYGSSVEGKIDRMIAPTDEATTDWVAFAGWLEPSRRPDLPRQKRQTGYSSLFMACLSLIMWAEH